MIQFKLLLLTFRDSLQPPPPPPEKDNSVIIYLHSGYSKPLANLHNTNVDVF